MRVSLEPQNNYRYLFLTVAIVSLLLSAWMTVRGAILNPDGICYVVSAEAIGTMGVKGIMHLCPQSQWPFYSALIYAAAKISHLSYPLAAHVIDSFFSLLSVITFVLIIKALGGTQRTLWFAAAVILLSHDFDSVREYIVRDHGFWAFYLVSMLCLIQFFKQPSLLKALAFSASILVAALFRVEGFIFWLLLPFVAWFQTAWPMQARVKAFLSLNIITGIGLIAGFTWLALHPAQTLGRLAEFPNQWQNGLSLILERYQQMKTGLATTVLLDDSVRDAGMVLTLTMMVYYVVSLIGNVSWIYGLLIAYAWLRPIQRFQTNVPVAYIIINLLITLTFLLERSFLSKRYLIALSLALMVWVPFALEALYQRSKTNKRLRIAFGIVGVCLVSSAIGGIADFGYSKQYVRQAGDWMQTNIPANARVYANDFQVLYYSHHFQFDLFNKLHRYVRDMTLTNGAWKKFDYVALRVDKRRAAEVATILNEMKMAPVVRFANKRGDEVQIYKVDHP